MTDETPIDEIAADLSSRIAGVKIAEPMSRYTTFRLGGPAAVFVEPASAEDLSVVAAAVAGLKVPTMVIGRGSNLLVSDDGFAGLVLRLGKAFDWIAEAPGGLRAGGAVLIPRLANWAARRSLSGLEFCVAIPASVGGAVKMNAGAHGASMQDVVKRVRLCDLSSGALQHFDVQDLKMSYRATSITQSSVVCEAQFALVQGERSRVLARMDSYREHRAATQPVEAPNAGSMFKNPEGLSAGKLIESAGLKGRRLSNAMVSDKHANFFLALDGANAQDVYDLMAHVQTTVRKSSGILLQPEVRVVGRFDTSRGQVLYS
ncbi:MAG: UDP-N-acetylmuramate dehydrogenase [Actinomycetota bacterium]|nr:UDP-N-acetylmuramate dehydrogenase [Actinomycetota bacterium]